MNIFKPLNIEPNDVQKEKLNRYYEFLKERNAVMNLTAITDLEGVYYKHFFDSLSLSKGIDLNQISTMLDIGSGAGFPGVVIKLFYPHIKLTIVDSLNKRIGFLKDLIAHLELNDIELVCDRAESFVVKRRNYYDLVTARAVAPIYILDELALPYVKTGGYLVAMKASNLEEELRLAKRGIGLLGGKVEEIISFELPNAYGERHLLKIKKVKENNQYPRAYKDIKKKPL